MSTSPRVPEIALRERKAAATRMAIVRALSSRLRHEPLSNVTADRLAADAHVSRVTFFNYFPTKEHALDLVLMAWAYETGVAARAASLSGRRAIEHHFDAMGEFVAESPLRAQSVLGYFASRPRERPILGLGAAERLLVAPEGPHSFEPQESIGATFIRLVDEARARGEIAREGTAFALAHMLGALLFGSGLIGHSTKDVDFRALYRHHVAVALGPVPTPRARKKGRKR